MLATLATLATLVLPQQTDTTIPVRQGTRLDVESFAGDITVKAWNQSSVRIHASHSGRDYVEISAGTSQLTVRSSSRRGPPSMIDYQISVPAWMPLTLSGVNTDIEVDGVQADVSAETVNGDVKVQGGNGFVALKSVQGSVTLAKARGHIELGTVNEDVQITDAAGDISAETVSGDITLERIESSKVEVTTVSGDVSYDGTIKDGGHYRFDTHNGDVRVGVPETANATIEVATFNGDFDSEFPVPLKTTTKHRFSFALGTGSARVEIETFNGDINLLRPGEIHGRHGKGKDRDKDKDNDNDKDKDDDP